MTERTWKNRKIVKTRIHSSRMRTVRSSGRISGAGVYLGVYLVPGGAPGPWGVYLVLGGCTWSRGCTWSGGCTWSQGGVPGLGGVPGPGGYLVWGVHLVLGGTWSEGVYLVPGGCTWSGGVYLVWGGCTWSGTPPGQTDTSKNITFATSLRTVIRLLKQSEANNSNHQCNA